MTDNQYHAGWAWAGSTPYKGTKLLASYFGGTRNPWRSLAGEDQAGPGTPRPSSTTATTWCPTIYEILGITPPREVNGVPQDPIDGVSFAYSFSDSKAKGRLLTQYFEIMGSRAIYHDGWMASAFGPRIPWVPGTPPGIKEWTPDKDAWELYNLEEDWSQAKDLAAKMPEKVQELKDTFLIEATKNKVLPIGGGLFVSALPPGAAGATALHAVDVLRGYGPHTGVCAPALGNKPNVLTIEAEVPANANGVLYKLGSNSGGLTLLAEDGILCYEYNLFIIQRTQIRATKKLSAGKVTIEVDTAYVVPRPGGPLKITLKANGENIGEGQVPISAPLLFTANDCLDIGQALGSPVSLDYRKKAPFKFNGKIIQVHVQYVTGK